MNHAYNSSEASKAYEEFLASTDGQIFRDILGKVFLNNLKANLDSGPKAGMIKKITILDAGCGDGWLAGLLCQRESLTSLSKIPFDTLNIYACDAGEPLIASAKNKFPNVEFTVCDLNKPLPYEQSFFDIICASMVIHDVEDELATLQNLSAVLKPGGKLSASIVNPYYGYPVGEWKRGVIGRLLGRMPKLKLAKGYNELARQSRPNFEWRPHLGSHFTPLSAHVSNAAKAGFALTGLTDLGSAEDSNSYNLTYQLHRFPIILLLEFTKL